MGRCIEILAVLTWMEGHIPKLKAQRIEGYATPATLASVEFLSNDTVAEISSRDGGALGIGLG